MLIDAQNLLDLNLCLPKDEALSFSDLYFFRVMLDGLLAQRKIDNSDSLQAWREKLIARLDIDNWIGSIQLSNDDTSRLRSLWSQAAALAWYHNTLGSSKGDRLTALQARLQVSYWRNFGKEVPQGWLSMLRRYQVPELYRFEERLPMRSDIQLNTAMHDLLVATQYLNRPLNMRMLFSRNTVQTLKSALEKLQSMDIRFEVLLILYGVGAMNRQQMQCKLTYSQLQNYLKPDQITRNAKQQKAYFRTQLLAQLLLLSHRREPAKILRVVNGIQAEG